MRTFIALDIPSKDILWNLQQELLYAARWNPNEVKPVEKQNFHFTLIFFGEVESDTIINIQSKLLELKFAPIEISYMGLGVFPYQNSARIIWIGIDERGRQKLLDLFENVTRKMKDIGIESDKSFNPHVTLFRIRDRKLNLVHILTRYDGKIFGSDTINKMCLKQSILTPTGPIYSDILIVHAK